MIEYFNRYGETLVKAFFTHLYYVLIPISIGFVIALIIGIGLSRVPRFSRILLPIISVFQTIPGIVFVGILFLVIGMIPATILIALTIYAIFPILKNTYVGILGVDEQYIDAAKGCGMSKFQILYKIELPLALPTIISGLRMSTIYTVSWAVLASMIGLGGLGDFIYQGVGTNNDILILTGAIPSAIMALSLGALIDHLQKWITPRGLRRNN